MEPSKFLNTPEVVYWYAPKTPAPVSRAQATGWPGPLTAAEQPGPCLWVAERGNPSSARHLSDKTTHELLAQLAIKALAEVPSLNRKGIPPRDPVGAIRFACRALAEHDARFARPEQYDRAYNMARHSNWIRYDRILAQQVAQAFPINKQSRLARLLGLAA